MHTLIHYFTIKIDIFNIYLKMRCHVLIRELEHAESFEKRSIPEDKIIFHCLSYSLFLHLLNALHAYNHLMLLGYIDVE